MTNLRTHVFFVLCLLCTTLLQAATADIVSYNASGECLGAQSNLSSAIQSAGANGRVVIGAGEVVLSACCDITTPGITIEGAGAEATVITGSAATFNNRTDGLASLNLNSRYKALLRTTTDVTLRNLSIDGGACGLKISVWIFSYMADFNAIRMNGNQNGATVRMYGVHVRGALTKSLIQVGSGANYTHAYAYGCRISKNGGDDIYASVDIASDASSFWSTGTYFEGLVQGNAQTEDAGYYQVAFEGQYGGATSARQIYTTTIPAAIDYYNSHRNLAGMIPALLDRDVRSGEVVIRQMTDDLCNANIDLYGYNKKERRQLARDFRDVLIAAQDDLRRAGNDVKVQDLIDDLNFMLDY